MSPFVLLGSPPEDRTALNMVIKDFDDTELHMSIRRKELNVFWLSIRLGCFRQLQEMGVMEKLESVCCCVFFPLGRGYLSLCMAPVCVANSTKGVDGASSMCLGCPFRCMEASCAHKPPTGMTSPCASIWMPTRLVCSLPACLPSLLMSLYSCTRGTPCNCPSLDAGTLVLTWLEEADT